MTSPPQTIDNDWDRFYREFPEVYDRFAGTSAPAVAAVGKMFDLDDKVIVDVGSGTGRSTFELAKTARLVVGIEPWAEMRMVALAKARHLGVRNVDFVDGLAEALPLRERSVDAVVSVYGFPFWFLEAGRQGYPLAERFVVGAVRAVRPGGCVVTVNSAPGWYAGELTPVLFPERALAGRDDPTDAFMAAHGFQHQDIEVTRDYGSVQDAVNTYGFIFGPRAIEYLTAHKVSSVQWRLRVHYRRA